MHEATAEIAKKRLRKAIAERAFVRSTEAHIVGPRGAECDWLFDIRAIALDPAVLSDIATLFWNTHDAPVQIGGMETAAIPLITALVCARPEGAHVSGFYLRKSRDKDGLMKIIEGTLNDKPIILVDDLTNSGRSLMRQVEVLEGLGHRVVGVWTLMRFRDLSHYSYFTNKGIAINSLFTLDDFTEDLGTRLLTKETPRLDAFQILWKFASGEPNFHYVVPKSEPVLDESRIYFGSDRGTMWALEQSDGSVAWSHTTRPHAMGKGIFSSPALHDGVLYFGGYDGNVYALDAATGATKWVSFEADWIGSSPALAPDRNLLLVGLEYGLWRRRGGIAALDMRTGKTVWKYEMPLYTHSSPLYLEKHHEVVVGSNDGAAYLFDADGNLLWKHERSEPTDKELDSGFGTRDIKESFAYDATRDLLVYGAQDGALRCLERKSGKLVAEFRAQFGFIATPLIHNNSVYATSLDKHVYCVDLDSFKEKWRWNSRARVFAAPAYIEGSIFVGSNTGRLTELDPETGVERSSTVFTERITNRVKYNPRTKHFFVPTFANEIYALKRKNPR